jgi:hypothetical protein
MRSAKASTANAATTAIDTASVHSGHRAGALEVNTTTVAIAVGPAIEGIASGTTNGSPAGSSPKISLPLRNTILIAIRNRITPPAMFRDVPESPKSRSNASPVNTNTSRTARAIAHSRATTRVRRAGSTRRSTLIATGMLPIGSTTSRSTTIAELRLSSIGRY